MKTLRGFELQIFKDDYGKKCSIQESSAPSHIWLGIDRPKVNIMYKDRNKLIGIDKVEKDDPDTGDGGWCTIPLPSEVLIMSRMHLNREQAKELADKLNYFAENGCLESEDF